MDVTFKKPEPPKIDAFELWCWRRLLRVPWTARRSNKSILKEIIPEYSLEGLMLKLLILWPPDAKNWLIWIDPDIGKDWRREKKGTTEDGINDSKDMSLSKLQEFVINREAWSAAVHRVSKSHRRLRNWTELKTSRAFLRPRSCLYVPMFSEGRRMNLMTGFNG